MIYSCRTTRPKLSNWTQVNANSPEEAANDFHFNSTIGINYIVENGSQKYIVVFACIEVDGHGEFIARWYNYPIWRRGGVKCPGRKTLDDVAKELDWPHEPRLLLEQGWLHEEVDIL